MTKVGSMAALIDLFAGAGGLSLGAARAGFELSGAVELDPFAHEIHAKNFPGAVHLRTDVSKLTGSELLDSCGLKRGQLSGLVGGPPCQGFSPMGKRAAEDARNSLFGHFFRLVAETNPAFFLAENVPGIMDERYGGLRVKALKQVEGYEIMDPFSVTASDYGVPTKRRRMFFFGYRPGKFKKTFAAADFSPPEGIAPVYVEPALQGLPERIDRRWQAEEQGWRHVEEPKHKGFFFDRAANSVPRGVGDPEATGRFFQDRLTSGCLGTGHSDEVRKRYGVLKHGETDPISKSTRLDPKGFCPTLRAGTGVDKGSFQAVRPIHFDRPRVITPREAARLQGFPDWFVFHRTKWQSFRQIGNSVSPVVAELILDRIRERLTE